MGWMCQGISDVPWMSWDVCVRVSLTYPGYHGCMCQGISDVPWISCVRVSLDIMCQGVSDVPYGCHGMYQLSVYVCDGMCLP